MSEPRVVHLDERLAVIDKPAGLVVHPAVGVRGPTLVDLLEGILGGGEPGRPGIVQRLDKDTSGLMVVARDAEAHRRLAAIVKARSMEQVTDLSAIEKVVDEIVGKNADKVAQARSNPKLIGWFVGQVMKASGGKANPQAVNDLLKRKLGV